MRWNSTTLKERACSCDSDRRLPASRGRDYLEKRCGTGEHPRFDAKPAALFRQPPNRDELCKVPRQQSLNLY